MNYVDICFEHDDLGGMVVFRVYPHSMTEEDWYRVKCAMNIYAWQDSVGELSKRIQDVLGAKGWCYLDSNLAWMSGEDADEMYRDFDRTDTVITFHHHIMA